MSKCISCIVFFISTSILVLGDSSKDLAINAATDLDLNAKLKGLCRLRLAVEMECQAREEFASLEGNCLSLLFDKISGISDQEVNTIGRYQ